MSKRKKAGTPNGVPVADEKPLPAIDRLGIFLAILSCPAPISPLDYAGRKMDMIDAYEHFPFDIDTPIYPFCDDE